LWPGGKCKSSRSRRGARGGGNKNLLVAKNRKPGCGANTLKRIEAGIGETNSGEKSFKESKTFWE